MADELSTGLSQLTAAENLKGHIVEVEFTDSDEVEIPHPLKVTPLYRIILRQKGAFHLIDGNTEWNDTAIFLKASLVGLSGLSATTTISDVSGVGNVGQVPVRTGGGSTTGDYWNTSDISASTSISGGSTGLNSGEVFRATILILAR